MSERYATPKEHGTGSAFISKTAGAAHGGIVGAIKGFFGGGLLGTLAVAAAGAAAGALLIGGAVVLPLAFIGAIAEAGTGVFNFLPLGVDIAAETNLVSSTVGLAGYAAGAGALLGGTVGAAAGASVAPIAGTVGGAAIGAGRGLRRAGESIEQDRELAKISQAMEETAMSQTQAAQLLQAQIIEQEIQRQQAQAAMLSAASGNNASPLPTIVHSPQYMGPMLSVGQDMSQQQAANDIVEEARPAGKFTAREAKPASNHRETVETQKAAQANEQQQL